MYLGNSNTGASFQSVEFNKNTAANGGAVLVSMAHIGVNFYNCSFDSNAAKGVGGAISAVTGNGIGTLAAGNALYMQDCSLVMNQADIGGAIYTDSDS